jgi:dUTP pyrophosphatase
MKINIQKLNENAVIPVYATKGSACFDLVSIEDALIHPGSHKALGTGLAFEIPEGYVMQVFSRSGHGFKNNIRLTNCTGIIDSDYRGEVKVGLYNDKSVDMPDNVFSVKAGDRIAQAMIVPVNQVSFVETDSLSQTDRGTGGFGSTGTGAQA